MKLYTVDAAVTHTYRYEVEANNPEEAKAIVNGYHDRGVELKECVIEFDEAKMVRIGHEKAKIEECKIVYLSESPDGLKDYFEGDFLIGTAINAGTFLRNDKQLLDIIKKDFNSITAANAFKWGVIQPKDNEWQFKVPDIFVDFGMKNNMHMLGHVLQAENDERISL